MVERYPASSREGRGEPPADVMRWFPWLAKVLTRRFLSASTDDMRERGEVFTIEMLVIRVERGRSMYKDVTGKSSANVSD